MMKEEAKDDRKLLDEYCQGREEAFEELFNRYKKKIYNYALRLLGNSLQAQDAAREVFSVLRSQPLLDKEQIFLIWLYKLARTACLKRQPRIRAVWPIKFSPSNRGGGDLVGGKAPHGVISAAVRASVAKLPLACKEAFILEEYQHLTYAQIAVLLGLSENEVRTLIAQARQKLKQRLYPFLLKVRNV